MFYLEKIRQMTKNVFGKGRTRDYPETQLIELNNRFFAVVLNPFGTNKIIAKGVFDKFSDFYSWLVSNHHPDFGLKLRVKQNPENQIDAGYYVYDLDKYYRVDSQDNFQKVDSATFLEPIFVPGTDGFFSCG